MPDPFTGAAPAQLLLLTIRFAAALRLTPFWGGRPLGLAAWAAISVSLAGLFVPIDPRGRPLDIGSTAFLSQAAVELLIGILIGTLARIAFSVLEMTGDLARIATLQLPEAGDGRTDRGAPIAKLYSLIGTAVFLLVGGHHAFIAGLGSSVACLPPGALPGVNPLNPASVSGTLGLFSSAMSTAVLLASPVFAAGISSELLVGLFQRIWPGSAAAAGTQALRALFVQLVLILTFGLVVSLAVDFLTTAVKEMPFCL